MTGLLLLLAPSALAAGPYPPPNEGGGQVDDSRVEAGECVIFSGSGFMPATEVTITDNGEFVGTVVTDRNGEFRYEVCFSADAQRGRHTLRGSGIGADGAPFSVSAVVFVTGVSQRPGSGPGRGTGATGEDGSGSGEGVTPGAGGSPTSSASPTATPTDLPRTSGPQAKADDEGMGLVGWLIVLALFAFLALLSSLVLLAGRRRRDEDDAAVA